MDFDSCAKTNHSITRVDCYCECCCRRATLTVSTTFHQQCTDCESAVREREIIILIHKQLMRSSRKTDKIHEEEEEDSLVVPDTLLGELNDALCQSAGACQSPEEVPRRRRLLNNDHDDDDDMNSEEHNDAFEDDELSDMDMDDHTSHDDSGSSDEDDSEEDESVVELNPNYQIYLNRSETVEEDISSQDSSFNQDNQDNEDEDASLSPATSFDSHESNVSFKKNEKLEGKPR